jgi:hypothetical protein
MVLCANGGVAGAEEGGRVHGLTCGLVSLRWLLHVVAKPVLSGDWQRIVDAYGARDAMTLAEVVAAGQEMGLHLSGWEMTLDELGAKGTPAIVHLKTGHFVTFLDVTDGAARWLDDGGAPRVAPAREFADRFSGYCLLPTAPPGQTSPRLAFADLHHDAGRLERESAARYCFVCTNVSELPVRVAICRTSSDCTASIEGPEVVAPGAACRVEVEGRAPTDASAVRFWVELASDDPGRGVRYLTLDALGPIGLTVSPERVGGAVKRGRGAVWRLSLRTSARTTVRAVATDVPHIDAVAGTPVGSGPEGVGLRIVPITLTLPADAPPGRMAGQLTITTDDPDTPVLAVPVAVRVLGWVTTRPTDLFFGEVRAGRKVVQELVLSAEDYPNLRIIAATSDVPGLVTERPIPRADGTYALMVRLEPQPPRGVVQGTLSIVTNVRGEEVILVPVYAHVAE